MSKQKTLFTQRDAATYLTEHGCKIHESELSRMSNRGYGPIFERVGYTKIFTQEDLDTWLNKQNTPETEEEKNRDHGKPAGSL